MEYSLVLRGNPRYPEKGKKVFASAQTHQVVKLDALAEHIKQHGTIYNESVIKGVVLELVDAIKEQLREGNQVELDKLGRFFVTLDCEGADTVEDFDPNTHITGLRPHWKPSKEFMNLRQNVEFSQTLDRRTQRKMLRESRIMRQNGGEPEVDNE